MFALLQNLPSGMSMHDFAAISALPVSSSLPGTIGVDFNDSTQPVSFTISVGGEQCNQVTIKAPVGELIRAVTMPEPLFITEQSEFWNIIRILYFLYREHRASFSLCLEISFDILIEMGWKVTCKETIEVRWLPWIDDSSKVMHGIFLRKV